jgi:hypothetical protein
MKENEVGDPKERGSNENELSDQGPIMIWFCLGHVASPVGEEMDGNMQYRPERDSKQETRSCPAVHGQVDEKASGAHVRTYASAPQGCSPLKSIRMIIATKTVVTAIRPMDMASPLPGYPI